MKRVDPCRTFRTAVPFWGTNYWEDVRFVRKPGLLSYRGQRFWAPEIATVRNNYRLGVRLVFIGELFFQSFQSLEIIGNMYQDTEAFWHYL